MGRDDEDVAKFSTIEVEKSEAARSPKVATLHQGWFIAGLVLLNLAAGFLGGWLAYNSNAQNGFSFDFGKAQTAVVQEGEVIADVAEQVSPSVVSISVNRTTKSIFGTTVTTGAGTGIVLTEEGLIVTNKHVVEGSATKGITVISADGTTYSDVEIVDSDPFNDIAFLQVNSPDKFQPAQLGNSDNIRVGQKVIAIGNTLGRYDHTVTSGIVSGVGRPLSGETGTDDNLENLIQTDAAINPGNSGGPLVNINGEVIGINTAIEGGDAENVGFSIPINDVKQGISSVEESGRIIRPYLGVVYVLLDETLAEQLNLPIEEGAYIPKADGAGQTVLSDSPAERAGLRPGDVILRIDGRKITNKTSLTKIIASYEVDEQIDLRIWRDGKERTINVVLKEAPDSL